MKRFYVAPKMTAETIAVVRKGVLIAHGSVNDPVCLAAVRCDDIDIYMAPDVHEDFSAWQQEEAARKGRLN